MNSEDLKNRIEKLRQGQRGIKILAYSSACLGFIWVAIALLSGGKSVFTFGPSEKFWLGLVWIAIGASWRARHSTVKVFDEYLSFQSRGEEHEKA